MPVARGLFPFLCLAAQWLLGTLPSMNIGESSAKTWPENRWLDLSWPGSSQSLYPMRPLSQLALRDASLAPASNFTEFLGELKKNDSVSGYHYVAPREPKLVELPETIDSRIRSVLDRRGI